MERGLKGGDCDGEEGDPGYEDSCVSALLGSFISLYLPAAKRIHPDRQLDKQTTGHSPEPPAASHSLLLVSDDESKVVKSSNDSKEILTLTFDSTSPNSLSVRPREK
ncbi:hypothetical protein EYF80_061059 [Liparis tanakae]|uniref:Uncharacterized protein n=1 Tax=Liparis tanakae TaxID=230148 RepID=A0A4Z2EIY9_9TELE|nr:hypothetical protein EYF80_061059 [Liparis tanakae]